MTYSFSIFVPSALDLISGGSHSKFEILGKVLVIVRKTGRIRTRSTKKTTLGKHFKLFI